MIIQHLNVEHRPGFQPEHFPARLHRLKFRDEDVFSPVDRLKTLLQSELGKANRLELLFLPRVS